MGLFLSILTIGITIGLIEKSFTAIYEAFWNYSAVLLSDTYAMQFSTVKTRVLASIWLLVITMMLSVYSGQLYEFVIRGKLVDKIETKEDLVTKSNWKNSKVTMFDLSSIPEISAGIELNDPVSLDLIKRQIIQDPFELYFNDNIQKQLIEGVMADNQVIISYKWLIYYFLRRVQNIFPQMMDNYEEGIDFYLSKPFKSSGCYSLVVNKDIIDLDNLNLM